MQDYPQRLNPDGFFMRLFTVLIALSMMAAQPILAQDIKMYGTAQKKVVVSSIKLKPGQKRHLSGLLKAHSYFGAMAVSRTEDISIHATGYHDLAHAIDIAQRACTERQKSPRPACELHMVILPKSLSDETRKASGLSRDGEKFFRVSFARKVQSNKGYASISINRLGNIGYSTGFSSMEGADKHAIAECDAGTAKTLLNYGASIRGYAKRKGYARCKVVHRALSKK